MDIAACKTRLADKVPDLAGRIEGASDFARMVEQGTIPQARAFAFLIPSGLRGQQPGSISGIFTQPVDETMTVVLGFHNSTAAARGALGDIDALIDATLAAFCGWAPGPDVPGVFRVTSGRMSGVQRGAVFYQLEFAITDQLRITP